MTDNLKPCPFCGGNNLKTGGDDKVVGVWCLTCQSAGPNHYGKHEWNDRAALSRPIDPKAEVEPVWRDGVPNKLWSDEWFIAETTYGDRVVLKALPEEWAYDFKTADDTYIKADRIKRWMQFPDSYYLPPASPSIVAPVGVKPLETELLGLAEKHRWAISPQVGGGWVIETVDWHGDDGSEREIARTRKSLVDALRQAVEEELPREHSRLSALTPAVGDGDGTAAQIEWLKARLAELQLPAGKRDHDTREKWFLQCGMPEAALSTTKSAQGDGELRKALEEIANSDDIENAIDPERNKRLAIAALAAQGDDAQEGTR